MLVNGGISPDGFCFEGRPALAGRPFLIVISRFSRKLGQCPPGNDDQIDHCCCAEKKSDDRREEVYPTIGNGMFRGAGIFEKVAEIDFDEKSG